MTRTAMRNTPGASPEHGAAQHGLQVGAIRADCYQPMYWPPLAERLAPVIQAASSGMKKATA